MKNDILTGIRDIVLGALATVGAVLVYVVYVFLIATPIASGVVWLLNKLFK